MKIFRFWVSERLVASFAYIGNIGKGAGVGEMIKNLVFLINSCCFLMCVSLLSLNGM